jgi:2-phospho-L-lactate guanylyltransferase
MARIVAVIPIRGSSSAKTRLAPLFTEDERLALVWAMLRRLLREIEESGVVNHTVVVTRDPEAVRHNVTIDPGVTVLCQHPAGGGLNGALDLAQTWAVAHGYNVMLVLPGDLPIIGAGDIRALVEFDAPLVVASDRAEQGTNALRIDLRCWTATGFRFRMGPGSLSHHFNEAAEMGRTTKVLYRVGIAHDLDSPGDWADLPSERQRQLLQDMHDSLNAAGHLA